MIKRNRAPSRASGRKTRENNGFENNGARGRSQSATRKRPLAHNETGGTAIGTAVDSRHAALPTCSAAPSSAPGTMRLAQAATAHRASASRTAVYACAFSKPSMNSTSFSTPAFGIAL